jgi:DNA adenine methylase
MYLAVERFSRRCIIGDLNKDLCNVWKLLQNTNIEAVIGAMKEFDKEFSKRDKRGKIELCRELTVRMENMPYNVCRAVHYLILKNCVYMGVLLRHNRYYFRGLDMSLYGRKKVFSDKYYENLRQICAHMHKTKIIQGDYKQILSKARPGDFVFLDPPYIEDHAYDFKYNKNEVLTKDFLAELLKEVKKLDGQRVKWMMTQADTDEVRRVFKEYHMIPFKVYRRQGDRYVNELIIRNWVEDRHRSSGH